MAYDPAYSEPADWDNELVSDTKLNQMKDNTQHNYKYKPELGLDAVAGIKIARGRGAVVFTADAAQTLAIVFSTDADDGNPSFSNTPRIVCSQNGSSDNGTAWNVAAISPTTTGFTISVGWDPNAGTYTGTIYVDWIAIGA